MKKLIQEFHLKYPLVKLIPIKELIYFYDARSNLLGEISKDEIINFCDEGNSSKLHIKLKNKSLFKKGYFKKAVPDDCDLDNIIEKQLNSYIPRKFILEITEECTLRCKYCFYSEETNVRTHSNNHMSQETAFKSIDYYFEIYSKAISKVSKSRRNNISKLIVPGISWWGGEPFMNFPLMKTTKAYIESLPWNNLGIDSSQMVYSVVTNFTILTPEIIDFIISTNLYLFISLDGGEVENDTNRVFTNGKGSFKTIMRNINTMIENYPDFCKKRMVLQSVKADNIDLTKVNKFFNSQFNICQPEMSILKYATYFQKNPKEYIPKRRLLNNENINGLIDSFKIKLDEISLLSSKELNDYFNNNILILQELEELLSLENNLVFDNPCITNNIEKHFSCPIGIDNIFINSKGSIEICTKSDQSFSLGNVKTGIDKKKMYDLYSNYYTEFRHNCVKCWALNFCKICPANLLYKGVFYFPKQEECDVVRENAYLKINKYIIFSGHRIYTKVKKYIYKNKQLNFYNFESPVSIY